MKWKRMTWLCLAILLWMTGCAVPEEERLTGAEMSEEHEVGRAPERIVSLTPIVIDFMDYYNISGEVLADTAFLSADCVKRTVDEPLNYSLDGVPDIEQIRNFRPDVIFTTSTDGKLMEKLSGAGRIVELSTDEDYTTALRENTLRLGGIFNVEREVNYTVLRMEEMRRMLGEKADRHHRTFTPDLIFEQIFAAQRKLASASNRPFHDEVLPEKGKEAGGGKGQAGTNAASEGHLSGVELFGESARGVTASAGKYRPSPETSASFRQLVGIHGDVLTSEEFLLLDGALVNEQIPYGIGAYMRKLAGIKREMENHLNGNISPE
ncbi:MAG: hypothetical protein Q4P30_05665 [Eubacteriales bacterium]|nr:hypothetical protein [Eubacteriales bacterium]